jgi:hypothetical protein
MLYALLALVTAAGAVFSWMKYTAPPPSGGNVVFLILFVILILATVAFGGMFLSGRVNKTEDIHITE